RTANRVRRANARWWAVFLAAVIVNGSRSLDGPRPPTRTSYYRYLPSAGGERTAEVVNRAPHVVEWRLHARFRGCRPRRRPVMVVPLLALLGRRVNVRRHSHGQRHRYHQRRRK